MTHALADISVELAALADLTPACDAGRVPCSCGACRAQRGHGEPCSAAATWTGRGVCSDGHVVVVLSCDSHRAMAQQPGRRRNCLTCRLAGVLNLQPLVWVGLR